MKSLYLFTFLALLIWPMSVVDSAVPDKPLFDFAGDGQLIFLNTHTNERIEIEFLDRGGHYIDDGFEDIDYILRCRLTNETVPIDRKLVSLIDHIQDHFDAEVVEIISGYRSPELNRQLRRRSRRVARHSLHMEGKAIDIRLPGVPSREIRDYAVSLRAGGVGYYSRRDFVHLDVGPVRFW